MNNFISQLTENQNQNNSFENQHQNQNNSFENQNNSFENQSINFRSFEHKLSDYKYGAGILPYTIYKNKLYFLIGKDRYEKYWSDFGGRSDPVDENQIENTAVREFYEETIGAIYDIKIIKERIKNKKDTYTIKYIKPNNVEYTMFILRIPYQDYRFTFNNVRNFIKYIIKCNKNNINLYKHFLEKEDIMWISYDSLIYHINNEGSKILDPVIIRQVFKNIILENIDLIKNIE